MGSNWLGFAKDLAWNIREPSQEIYRLAAKNIHLQNWKGIKFRSKHEKLPNSVIFAPKKISICIWRGGKSVSCVVNTYPLIQYRVESLEHAEYVSALIDRQFYVNLG